MWLFTFTDQNCVLLAVIRIPKLFSTKLISLLIHQTLVLPNFPHLTTVFQHLNIGKKTKYFSYHTVDEGNSEQLAKHILMSKNLMNWIIYT